MDSKELRGLMEAYSEVYAPEQLDELSVNKMLAYGKAAKKDRDVLNKKWDEKKASHKEKMRVLGHEEGEERAAQKIKKKTGKYPHQMNALDKARYAVTKEELDIFDAVLEFLQAEGFAETLQEAEWMMANDLDADDIEEIVEAIEAYFEVYAPREKIEEKFVDPSHGPFDDPKRIGMKSPNKNMMDKHKKLMSKGDPESTARAGKIAKAKLQTTLRAYGNNVDEATVVASPAPGGRGKKNPYTKEVRTSAPTKTSSGYSNVKDAKDRMKKPLSRYPKPEMQLKDVKEAQYTPPPQPQQPPAEVRKAPKKAPNPVTTVGTGLAAAYVGNEIGKQLLKKKPVRGVFEEADIYDIVLSHLLDEGYADTVEAAEAIMVNMSEVWREDIIDEAYVDYRKGKLPSGRTPQTSLKSGVERAKVNASREQRAGGSSGTTATPSWKRSKKAGAVGDEMDANTSFGGKVNKVVNLGRRDNAGPSVQRGEPNTVRHQQAIDARAKKA